ncbi:MAG TPA: acyl-CoA dehydrogenase family protein, partial [Blastocatellia bacterium]|nr:acyl-CoA dehydrogenase family protein [Blastocatellia bacterium]
MVTAIDTSLADLARATGTQPEYPYFTEEHHMLRETVKQFCQAELAPHTEEWDEAGIFPKEVFKKVADMGLFGIRI